VSVESPLWSPPATAASAEANEASTPESFTAKPEDATQMASSSYTNALFEALAGDLAMPTLAPALAIHAPVEAMAAEIEAADLVSSNALDGLPPPARGDEPVALASEEAVAEEMESVAFSPVATTIDSVPIPEAAQWGAQALAALGSQAGVEIPSLQPSLQVPSADVATAREAESREAESHETESNEVPSPVSDPAIDEAFATAEAFEDASLSPGPPPLPEVDVGSAALAGDGKHTLLFAPTTSGAANLEDELIDERGEAEPDVAQAPPKGDPLVAQVFETDRPEPPVAQANRASNAPATGEDDSAAESSPPRLAHAMPASGEQLRPPTTRTAKKSAEDMQLENTDLLQDASSSRRRKLRFVAAAGVALAGAAAAILLFRPPLRARVPLPEVGKRAASVAAKQAPPPSVKEPTAARPSAAGKEAPAVALQSSKKDDMVTVPIASKPEGAMVWIDGEERGKTPCGVKLKPGGARVTLVREGYMTSQSTVDVSDGAKVDVTLQTAPPPTSGEARFRAECATRGKLPIVVDGRETGVLCPFSKLRLNPGSHTIGLFNPATGKIHSKEISLSAGVRSINFGD
jgi:hypothetical protein